MLGTAPARPAMLVFSVLFIALGAAMSQPDWAQCLSGWMPALEARELASLAFGPLPRAWQRDAGPESPDTQQTHTDGFQTDESAEICAATR